MGIKMKKIMRIFVPILVLALLIQLPLSASASTLSDASKIEFDVMAAPDGSPANTQIKMYITTTSTEAITTVGSTIVLKNFPENFALLNDSAEDVSATYMVDKVQLGAAFPITASEIGDDQFIDFAACSLASYNSNSKEMYLFISGWNDGIVIPSGVKTEVATFYVQAKDGVTPSSENIRLMRKSEYKNTDACPSVAVYPAEVSSKDIILQPDESDILADEDVILDFPEPAVATGTVTGSFDCKYNNTAEVTVALMDGDNVVASTTACGDTPDYTLSEVAPGTYTIKISAVGSLGFTIENVVVAEGENKSVPTVTLLFGDYDGNGVIATTDFSNIITAYSTNTYEAAADVDGNGVITTSDINYAISHYNKLDTEQVITL